MTTKTFTPLVLNSRFHSCDLPLNLDTYRQCEFNCRYCYLKNKIVGKRNETLKPNIKWLQNKFHKIYDEKNINKTNFIEMLLKNRITLHCGTKSDSFQYCEKADRNTETIIDLCNQYDQKIVFTTKSDTSYNVNITPQNHSFQFSVTNHFNDKFLEPNVPSLENRVKFYKDLKDKGFQVGIRIEPFIPNVTDVEKIVEHFEEPAHIMVSRLLLNPQNLDEELIKYTKYSQKDWINKGMTELNVELRYNLMKPIADYLESTGYSYSISERDMKRFTNNRCCCGDKLTWNTTGFGVSSLIDKYGADWTLNDLLEEVGEYKNCNCSDVMTSNRRGDIKTVEDFYRDRWNKHTSTFHPSKQFKQMNKTLFDF